MTNSYKITDANRIDIYKKSINKLLNEYLDDVEDNKDYKQGVKDGLKVAYSMLEAVENMNVEFNVSFDGLKTSGGESDEPGTD
ncbi:hypothetical protein EVU91_04450 [Macrococcoides bohemicum]|uniref:hypothetical protein n=1 Tax=Macrococcoides bohemicum TaxID=1903056 RepID=UPI001059F15C|nr:hypothetical protein [Macrococcus bohemicus]TDL39400.1 hypothetical protein EVU91_04450 [Macrococcus bohemicus]